MQLFFTVIIIIDSILMNADKPYDFLIVGAGLYGSSFAWRASQAGLKCLVIDRRSEVGGNIGCDYSNGICVHKYGPHIFHTSNYELWRIVNQLTPFNNFINTPLARNGNKIYNLPFNMNTFYQLWGCTTPSEAQAIIHRQQQEAIERQISNGHYVAANLEEQALRMVGKDIYRIFIKCYSEKQWGRECSSLPSSIIKRLPLRFSFNNNYFDDKYQGVPEKGYNDLIDNMLVGVKVILKCNYCDNRDYFNSIAKNVIYTGSIDEFFDYSLGKLQYRSVHLDNTILQIPSFQGVAVVNYTSDVDSFTRIIEHKYFEPHNELQIKAPITIISKEFSEEWTEGKERCYPITTAENLILYNKYKDMALNTNVAFGGRLAEFKYYNMDEIILRAFETVEKYRCKIF